ncbi:K(+)/H(+) antiporter NhaP [Planctomycetes bacterium Pan216]|uniref:K(+)/H(+) antiporter NhaP n=1 Tax=Kolteria novifilia TaxID=2527975 RepID=A0A518AX71_9BACT|nr:K(+)/H(+) antiporter NhaP [Planctomycetes bacterium Pan216]
MQLPSVLNTEHLLFAGSILLIVAVLASQLSAKWGVPALLIFLGIGVLAGSDGIGGIPFEDAKLAQGLGILALVLILFSGGLNTDWRSIVPVIRPGLILATGGVLLSTFLVGIFAYLVCGIGLLDGFLLGAMISSTDAAAVFAVLRSRGVPLRPELASLIEFESGSNDPMAVFLTNALIGLQFAVGASFAGSLLSLIPSFFIQMIVGSLCGWGAGHLIVFLLRRFPLAIEELYPTLSVGLALLTYAGVTLINGNGFLAVYLAGIVVGNHSFEQRRQLMSWHEYLAWFMQIVMFLTLGLLVFPSEMPPLIGQAIVLSAFLMFVSRPASVFACLPTKRFTTNEKIMVSWGGLRGAVPIIMATYAKVEGLPIADYLLHAIFFIVVTSVLLQGTTLSFMAQWLQIAQPQRQPLPPTPTSLLAGETSLTPPREDDEDEVVIT